MDKLEPQNINFSKSAKLADPDPDKELNSKCFCGIGLPWKDTPIVMAYPCEHMYHESCYKKNKKTQVCPLCNSTITRMLSIVDKDIHPQRFADMLSMTHYSDMSNNNPIGFIDSIFDLASLLIKLPLMENATDGKRWCETVFGLNNLTLKVHGMEKLKLEPNKVFIVNHVTYLEFLIIYYLFNTGFLASSVSDQSAMMKHFRKFVNILTVQRGSGSSGSNGSNGSNGSSGKDANIVDKMREFVDKYGSICLFPEGMMSHPDALVRFRTGAFHIGRPIYAIAIRYPEIVSDGYINNMLYKIGAKRDITIEVNILGPYYPPFNQTNIEQIRSDMAYSSKMVLSRVTNRDIKDDPNKKETIL